MHLKANDVREEGGEGGIAIILKSMVIETEDEASEWDNGNWEEETGNAGGQCFLHLLPHSRLREGVRCRLACRGSGEEEERESLEADQSTAADSTTIASSSASHPGQRRYRRRRSRQWLPFNVYTISCNETIDLHWFINQQQRRRCCSSRYCNCSSRSTKRWALQWVAAIRASLDIKDRAFQRHVPTRSRWEGESFTSFPRIGGSHEWTQCGWRWIKDWEESWRAAHT